MNTYDLSQWGKTPPTAEVSVVAVGGFPVVSLPANWKEMLREGFGQGAVLTFGNPNGKTLHELAWMCAQRSHLWWLGALSMTWLVYQNPIAEMEIARSGEAHLSWQERVQEFSGGDGSFLACFDLRTARKYFRHADDTSFKREVRRVLKAMHHDLTETILPFVME